MDVWPGMSSGKTGREWMFFPLVPKTSHDRVKLSLPERWVRLPCSYPCLSLASHAVVGVPHRKKRKMGTDVSSGLIFLKKRMVVCRMEAGHGDSPTPSSGKQTSITPRVPIIGEG